MQLTYLPIHDVTPCVYINLKLAVSFGGISSSNEQNLFIFKRLFTIINGELQVVYSNNIIIVLLKPPLKIIIMKPRESVVNWTIWMSNVLHHTSKLIHIIVIE